MELQFLNKHEDYLKTFEFGNTLLNRINEIIALCTEICPEEISDIFFTEYIDSEGKRIFESLYCLSENFIMESNNFRYEYDIDLVNYSLQLDYLQVKFEGYDLKLSNENSRMTVFMRFKNTYQATLKATGTNCDFLKSLTIKYFKNKVC